MQELQLTKGAVESKVIMLRNQHVILDSDVAELYEVETRQINEAVNNNPEKFPEGYVFELQNAEKQEAVENFDRFANLKHSKYNAKAFTEKGLYMLATILKSKRATEITIEIAETSANLKELARILAKLAETHSKEKKMLTAQLKEAKKLLNDGSINEQEFRVLIQKILKG